MMDRRIFLLPEAGAFYKANLHCHTTLSGGKFTPEQIKELYKARGYQILAITDLGIYRDYQELDEEGLVTIPGAGVMIQKYHFNLLDVRPNYKREEKERGILAESKKKKETSVNQYIAEMKEKGFFVCYNHPYWSGHAYCDYKELDGLDALEIYNHACENDGLCGYNPQAYDEILRLGKRIRCIAADGNFNQEDVESPLFDSFGGITMIKTDKLERDAVINALKAGSFYSTMGPEIKELYIEEGKIVIKTSPVKRIYIMFDATLCYSKIAESNEVLTEARFELQGNESYIRVEIIDEYGKYANSNAYFLKDIGYFENEIYS